MDVLGIVMGVGTVVGTAVLRSVLGWFQKAFADGKIEAYEWRKLGETVFRVGAMGLAGYFGLELAGVDIPVAAAAFGAMFVDYILSRLR